MSFLNYGSAKALSYRHDYGADIDRLYKQEAYRSQVKAEKEQKTRYYAGLMKEHQSASPWATKQLEKKYKDLNNRVADFAINNPNFETDVNKMQEFMSLTDEYLNNDIVRKDIQSQQQFEILKQASANGKISQKNWLAEMEKYDNWMQNGGDGYVFSNITLPKYTDIVQNSKKTFMTSKGIYKEGNMYVNKEFYSRGQINSRAIIDLQDDEFGSVIQQEYEKYNESNPGIYKSALDFHVAHLNMDPFVERTFAAWDEKWKSDVESQKKAQREMSEVNPYYASFIAPNFKVGSIIEGEGLEAFTEAGTSKSIDLGKQGREIMIDDGKGGFKKVRLNGRFTLDNASALKVTPTGAFVKVNVTTRVDPKSEIGNKTYTVNNNGKLIDVNDPYKYFQDKGYKFSEKDLRKMEAGETIDNISIQVNNPLNSSKQFEEAGFLNQGKIGFGASTGFDNVSSYPSYTGSMWIPANISEETVATYEKIMGGQDHSNKINKYGLANYKTVVAEAVNAGSFDMAIDMLTSKFGGEGESGMTGGSMVVSPWTNYMEGNKKYRDVFSREIDVNGEKKLELYNASTGKIFTQE